MGAQVLLKQIVERKKDKFYGTKSFNLLAVLDEPEQAEQLKSSIGEFYDTVLDHIDKWFLLEHANIPGSCFGPRNSLQRGFSARRRDRSRVAEKDELCDEVSQLNSILMEIHQEAIRKEAEEKWKLIFKDNPEMPNLYELVSRILSIPVSNTFVERIFSLCAAQWTKEWDLLKVETVKALLQIKANFVYSCPKMLAYLMKNRNLRQGIRISEKY